MSTKYKFHDQDKLYFVSFSVVYWIDLFIRNEYKRVLPDSWKHCQKHKGLEIYGWCIMTISVRKKIKSSGLCDFFPWEGVGRGVRRYVYSIKIAHKPLPATTLLCRTPPQGGN